MKHAATGVEIDVSRASLPFELEARAAARDENLAGVRIAVIQAEALIIFKAVAWRPIEQQDEERLLTLYGARLDLERIRLKALDAALEVDRVRELDAVLARTRRCPPAGA
jgi:hypothetical protein